MTQENFRFFDDNSEDKIEKGPSNIELAHELARRGDNLLLQLGLITQKDIDFKKRMDEEEEDIVMEESEIKEIKDMWDNFKDNPPTAAELAFFDEDFDDRVQFKAFCHMMAYQTAEQTKRIHDLYGSQVNQIELYFLIQRLITDDFMSAHVTDGTKRNWTAFLMEYGSTFEREFERLNPKESE